MNGEDVVEAAENLDIGGGDPHFLLGLAQRRGQKIGVLPVPAAAGEGYLAGVLVEVIGAAGQQQVVAPVPGEQRQQHRRRAPPPAVEGTQGMPLQCSANAAALEHQASTERALRRIASMVPA